MSAAARILALCAAAALLWNTPIANGAPVELDSPKWHAIVVRPVDLWVGDKGTRADTLAVVADRKANYQMYVRGQCCLRGGPLILQGPSDDPIVHGRLLGSTACAESACSCRGRHRSLGIHSSFLGWRMGRAIPAFPSAIPAKTAPFTTA